jgi:hypothetical protein
MIQNNYKLFSHMTVTSKYYDEKLYNKQRNKNNVHFKKNPTNITSSVCDFRLRKQKKQCYG